MDLEEAPKKDHYALNCKVFLGLDVKS